MATYIGYYQSDAEFARENSERARREGLSPDPQMAKLVRELPDRLPSTLKLIGSWTPLATHAVAADASQFPGVMIYETDDPAELSFINRYYAGRLNVRWLPATTVGSTRREREQLQEANAPAVAR